MTRRDPHSGLGIVWAAALALGIAGGAQAPPAPSAQAVFQEAKTDAAQLPDLLAARELGLIAQDEMVALPAQGLRDYAALYARVHAWPALEANPVQKARTELRFREEGDAIQAYAAQARFDTALQWLAAFHPVNDAGAAVGIVCSNVMVKMLAHGLIRRADDALRQCANQGGDFPFEGAATALDDTAVPLLQRMEIAGQGVTASASAANSHAAAIFLAAVHNAFPARDGEVESAILALLQHTQADAQAHSERAVSDRNGGALLLSVLAQLDPERAEAARAQFPAAAGAIATSATVRASPTGRVLGLTQGLSPDARLYQLAATRPAEALAGAEQIQDDPTRFAALAGTASQSARTQPTLATRAANGAYSLLDKQVAASETGYVADLAFAYFTLGDRDRSHEVAVTALSAADKHAEEAEQQFDLSTLESVAKLQQHLLLPAAALSYPYASVAPFLPALALEHARNCACDVMRPLILARIAEGLTAAGARLAR